MIWRETAAVSRYPTAELTWSDVKELHLGFRRWYFAGGGLFLSERSRARYGDVQNLLGAYLAQAGDMTGPVEPDDYHAMMEACSALRTAMTQDLATRRQRSPAWALATWRWHRAKARKAQQRIQAAGGGSLRCPLEELRLDAPASPPVPVAGPD